MTRKDDPSSGQRVLILLVKRVILSHNYVLLREFEHRPSCVVSPPQAPIQFPCYDAIHHWHFVFLRSADHFGVATSYWWRERMNRNEKESKESHAYMQLRMLGSGAL